MIVFSLSITYTVSSSVLITLQFSVIKEMGRSIARYAMGFGSAGRSEIGSHTVITCSFAGYISMEGILCP